jgi:hypothetical protein
MIRIAVVVLIGLGLCACASTPSRRTADSKQVTLFAHPVAEVQKAAVDSLVVLGFEVKKNLPDYVEGARPRKMGIFVGSGGETVGVWLEAIDAGSTSVAVDTARTFVGIAGQKIWNDEVLAEMKKSLSPTKAEN